jgi:enamine deaminase RidA (YjgF/YER057c/UK114 family)
MAGIMETHRNNVKVPIFAVQTRTAPRRGAISSLFGPAPMTDPPLARLGALGLSLPTMPSPVANYGAVVIEGNLLFLSGQGPRRAEGGYFTGKVGRDVTVEEAYEHARATGLQLISVMNTALGDLSRVRRIVKVLGMVNGMPDFADQPKVINGCSDLFVAVFGDKGRHARSAVGMGSLPNGISVEIEAIVAID